MAGYIANTDGAAFEYIRERQIWNPVFWFKRDRNPSSTFIVKGNYVFLRITRTKPPVISAFGKIAQTAAMSVQEAFDTYGRRLFFESINDMIEHSATWTSSVDLSPATRIFCIGIDDLKLIRDIRVDRDLEPLGILFDYQHIVTGKGIDAEQTSALLRHVEGVS